MNKSLLAGSRVLLAEDDAMMVLLIEDLLSDAGCEIVGPFATVSEARNAVQLNKIDLALLDLSLKDGNVYPVAELLSQRAVPFLILSGYGAESGPTDRPGWHWHSKPFRGEELLAKLQELILRR